LQRLQAQAGTSPARLSALLDELVRRLGSGAPIPSGAELGRVLGISRKRVSELLADLIQRSASLADED
jgi:biotin operon repressor